MSQSIEKYYPLSRTEKTTENYPWTKLRCCFLWFVKDPWFRAKVPVVGKCLLSPSVPKSSSTHSSSHYLLILATNRLPISFPHFSNIFQFPLLAPSPSLLLQSFLPISLFLLPFSSAPAVPRGYETGWETRCVCRCHGLSSPSWGSFDGVGDYSPCSLGCTPLSHSSSCGMYIYRCSHMGAILKIIAQISPTQEIPFYCSTSS